MLIDITSTETGFIFKCTDRTLDARCDYDFDAFVSSCKYELQRHCKQECVKVQIGYEHREFHYRDYPVKNEAVVEFDCIKKNNIFG